MKKTTILLALALCLAHAGFSQNSDLTRFVDKHKKEKNMSFALLSKDMCEVTAQQSGDQVSWKKVHNVVQNVGSLTMLAGENLSNSQALYKEACRAAHPDDMDELLTVQDGNDKVNIWVKSDNDVVTDLVLLVGSESEFVLVSFTGNLELSNLMGLADLFNADNTSAMAKSAAALALDFSVSPNPGSDVFTITCADGADKPMLLTIVDPTGRQVANLNLTSETTQQIRIPNIPADLYLFQVKTEKGKIGVRQVQVVK